MALTYIVDCAGLVPALKKPNCAFRPHKVTKVVVWAKGVKFDVATANFNDATFDELVRCGQMFSFEVPVVTDNTTETVYESVEGQDKKTANGIVDMDFVLRCLSFCERKEYQKINNSWNVAFIIEDTDRNQKLFAAVDSNGIVTGFDLNIFGVKSDKLGTGTTSSTLILRAQFSTKGSKQFVKGSDLYDIDLDVCDYNVANLLVQEIDPVVVTGNIVTVNHRYVEACDGKTPVEGVGGVGVNVYLVASNGTGSVLGVSTPLGSDPSIVQTVFDLTGTTILGENPFYTQIGFKGKTIVAMNDCYFRAQSGTFSI